MLTVLRYWKRILCHRESDFYKAKGKDLFIYLFHCWCSLCVANGHCVQWLTKGGSSLPPPLPGLNRAPERGWHGVTFPPQSCAHDVWAAQRNQFPNPQWGIKDTEEIIRNQPRIEMCSCVYTHSFNKKFTLPFTI